MTNVQKSFASYVDLLLGRQSRKLVLAAVAFAIASPVCAYAGNDADVSAEQFEIVREHCAGRWPTDFDMRAYCEKKQFAGIRELNSRTSSVPVRPMQQQAPAPEPQASLPEPGVQAQASIPVAPLTLPAAKLIPLSLRLAEINQLARQSLPIITRHCGTDAVCRKDQTAAMHDLVAKETAIAKGLRNPTSYSNAVLENDRMNACKVMWNTSEDFVALVGCINDAAPSS